MLTFEDSAVQGTAGIAEKLTVRLPEFGRLAKECI